MTMGQVIKAFDAMARYIMLTNPFGSGEGSSKKTSTPGRSADNSDVRNVVRADEFGSADVAIAFGGVNAVKKRLEDLPPHVQDTVRAARAARARQGKE